MTYSRRESHYAASSNDTTNCQEQCGHFNILWSSIHWWQNNWQLKLKYESNFKSGWELPRRALIFYWLSYEHQVGIYRDNTVHKSLQSNPASLSVFCFVQDSIGPSKQSHSQQPIFFTSLSFCLAEKYAVFNFSTQCVSKHALLTKVYKVKITAKKSAQFKR